MTTSSDDSSKAKKRGAFRKAPDAPKRFKSPYIIFSMSRMEKYRQEMGSKTKVTSISKLVSDEWKNMPVTERKEWEERARLDKERFNAEKSLYTGPWQVPSKRARKDPSAPKRPMSAFLFYSQGKRSELQAQNPHLKNTDISRLLGEQWKGAPEGERSAFIEREKEVRKEYNREMLEWRRQKEQDEEAVKKHRQRVAEQWIQSGYQTHGSGLGAHVSFAPGAVFTPAPTTETGHHMDAPATAPTFYNVYYPDAAENRQLERMMQQNHDPATLS